MKKHSLYLVFSLASLQPSQGISPKLISELIGEIPLTTGTRNKKRTTRYSYPCEAIPGVEMNSIHTELLSYFTPDRSDETKMGLGQMDLLSGPLRDFIQLRSGATKLTIFHVYQWFGSTGVWAKLSDGGPYLLYLYQRVKLPEEVEIASTINMGMVLGDAKTQLMLNGLYLKELKSQISLRESIAEESDLLVLSSSS